MKKSRAMMNTSYYRRIRSNTINGMMKEIDKIKLEIEKFNSGKRDILITKTANEWIDEVIEKEKTEKVMNDAMKLW